MDFQDFWPKLAALRRVRCLLWPRR